MSEERRFDEGVIDLSQFREKKAKQEEHIEPFFTEPTILTLGDPTDEDTQMRYMLLVNLAINGKQYLALEGMEESEKGEVGIVEALFEDGVFSGVQVVEEEEYEEIAGMVTEVLNASSQGEESDDTDQ